MDLRKLKTLIDLVSESNVSELEITEAEGKVRIVKASGVPMMMMQQPAVAMAVAPAVAAPAAVEVQSCLMEEIEIYDWVRHKPTPVSSSVKMSDRKSGPS